MKTNKKLIVSSLASVMAISMVGSIAGTVAWYQYSTRATVSMIGMNVAETGILEISKNGSDWQRDLTSSDLALQGSRAAGDFSLTPCTFAGANQTATGAIDTSSAYKNPDVSNKVVKSDGSDYATRGSYATAWDAATAKDDFIQYNVYLRARTVDNATGGFTQTAENVYITDYVLANVGSGAILEGLRVHLAIDADGDETAESYLLLSNTAKDGLKLYGYLDQDDDGIADRVGGYEWATHRDDHITYGEGTYTQTTAAIAGWKASRDAGNNYAIAAGDSAKKILTTPTTGAAIITVTIWLEGWDLNLGSKNVDKFTFESFATEAGVTDVTGKYYQRKSGNSNIDANYALVDTAHSADGKAVAGYSYFTRTAANPKETVADWSGLNTDGAQFQFGLTFDVGRDSFKD